MVRSIRILTCVLLVLGMGTAHAAQWQKYVAADKSFSFHYPKGWRISEQDPIIEITNPASTGEQMLVLALQGDENKTPRDMANAALSMFKQSMPDMAASNWTDHPDMVTFQVAFTDKGVPNVGHVLVMKTGNQAMWFSIAGPKAHYDTQKCVGLLQGLVGSVATGAGSKPPVEATPVKVDKVKLEKDAKAFIFVLEFALGAPFTAGQEKIILDELRAGWPTLTPDQIAKHDEYPKVVAAIMKGDQHDLELLRTELEKSIREWIDEVDQTDPAVKAVKNQLNASSKILAEGDPPLSEMAATAYAEMMAYSGLLKKNPKATPDQIPAKSVTTYKGKIIKAWSALSSETKADACSMPGVWMTLRQLIRAGTPAEQKYARTTLAKVGGSQQSASSGGSSSSNGGTKPMSMVKHSVLMNIQQQTFNSYMWSRGYSGWTPMGKMW